MSVLVPSFELYRLIGFHDGPLRVRNALDKGTNDTGSLSVRFLARAHVRISDGGRSWQPLHRVHSCRIILGI